MTDGYGRARIGGRRRATVAGVEVEYRLAYRPGNRSADPDDVGVVVGGLSVALRVGGRQLVYGNGYVRRDGSVVRPMLDCESDDGELGDDEALEDVLGNLDLDARVEVQGLLPSYVEPWRWGRARRDGVEAHLRRAA